MDRDWVYLIFGIALFFLEIHSYIVYKKSRTIDNLIMLILNGIGVIGAFLLYFYPINTWPHIGRFGKTLIMIFLLVLLVLSAFYSQLKSFFTKHGKSRK
jgi:hypothetical protein